MRRSNLARKPRGNVDTKFFPIKGGLNLVDAPITMPPGMNLNATNYELLTRDGIRRLEGYERSDGQARPSEASYWILSYNFSITPFDVDDIVDGDGGAQGKVLLDIPGPTNLFTRSEEVDHSDWILFNLPTVTPNTDVAPDGSMTADTLIDVTASITRIHQSPSTFTATLMQFLSVFVKKDLVGRAAGFPAIQMQFTGSTTENYYLNFDTSNGEVFTEFDANPSIVYAVDSYDANWWRVSLGVTSLDPANTTRLAGLYPNRGSGLDWTVDFNATGSIVVWGAQLEQSSVLGQYSKTVASAIAGGHLVLTDVTGSFVDEEDLDVSAAKRAEADGTAVERGAATPVLDATYAQDAIETQRDLILKVGDADGSGPVRGIHEYKSDIYAFRDNSAVTACLMWKQTSSGWVEQALGNRIHFTDGGGGAAYVDTEVITGTVSGASATILRVVLQSGTWGTDATGYFVIGDVASAPFQAEATTGSVSGAIPIDGAEVAQTIAPGGRFEFRNDNFFATDFTRRMYGVSGVDYAFEFDGAVFVPIITANIVDTPSYLEVNEFHLVLAFANGSLQNSATGDPYVWAGGGAAEIGIGDEIVGLYKEVGGALIILCMGRIRALHGKGTMESPWDLKTISDESGGIPRSLDRIGETRFMDDQGFMNIKAVQAFGDFVTTTYSQLIEPLIQAKKKLLTSVVIVKAKSQMRIFFSDGSGIIATFNGKQISGFTTIVYKNAVGTAIPVSVVTNGEDSDGSEVLYFGSIDGFVYQMDSGNSFDGGPIEATAVLPYYHLGTPSYNKQFKKILIEVAGSSGTVLKYNALYDYSSGKVPVGRTFQQVLASGGSFWNQGNWNAFAWASEDVTRIEGAIDGVARNIAIQLSSSSTFTEPHTLYGITYHYIMRKLVR